MAKSGRTFKAGRLGVSEFGFDVAEALKDYVQKITSKLKVKSVIVFGSRARGDWNPWSDVDVLVIAEDLPNERSKLLAALAPDVSDVEFELRAYAPDEFLDAITALDLTALDAVYEGKVIHDDGFWKNAREKFNTARDLYRLRRIRNGWVAQKLVEIE